MKNQIVRIAVSTVALTAVGAGTVTLVYGETSSKAPGIIEADSALTAGLLPTNRATNDPAPGLGLRSSQARTRTRRGEQGVLVYKNKAGKTCIASGRPSADGTQVMSPVAPEKVVPIDQVGVCGLPTPIGYQVFQTPDETTVIGLAGDEVASVDFSVGTSLVKATLASDKGFIASVPAAASGPAALIARLRDGSTKRVGLNLIDLNAATEQARRNAPPDNGLQPESPGTP